MPIASIATSASPVRGAGSGTSSRRMTPASPYSWMRIAFMPVRRPPPDRPPCSLRRNGILHRRREAVAPLPAAAQDDGMLRFRPLASALAVLLLLAPAALPLAPAPADSPHAGCACDADACDCDHGAAVTCGAPGGTSAA